MLKVFLLGVLFFGGIGLTVDSSTYSSLNTSDYMAQHDHGNGGG